MNFIEIVFESFGLSCCSWQEGEIREGKYVSAYAEKFVRFFLKTSFGPDHSAAEYMPDHFLGFLSVKEIHSGVLYVVGPYRRWQADETKCIEYMSMLRINRKQKRDFFSFVQQLPFFDFDQHYKMMTTLYALLNNKILQKEEIAVLEKVSHYEVEPSISMLQERHSPEEEDYGTMQQMEETILYMIQSGNSERLKAFMQSHQFALHKFSFEKREKSYYYSALHSLILASRAAVWGGLSYAVAQSICDIYILQLEKTQDLDQILSLIYIANIDYAARVEAQQLSGYSPLVRDCIRNVMENLGENVQLFALAKKHGVQPSYLSRIFKQETRKTFKKYVEQVKMKEAGRLLLSTKLSLAEIAEQLSYSSQSYFQNVFKAYTNMTPLAYRKEYYGRDFHNVIKSEKTKA